MGKNFGRVEKCDIDLKSKIIRCQKNLILNFKNANLEVKLVDFEKNRLSNKFLNTV